MSLASLRPTFRDPAGSLSFHGDLVLRTIEDSARSGVLTFLDSNFCRAAQARGDLIAAEVDPSARLGGPLRLLHPRVAIPTYPWEWTPSQWLAAADLTLSLAQEALSNGWILKDATPLNVLFLGTRAVFVDILSFEPRDSTSSIWLAYGQYVRTFLLPLLGARVLHWPLALTLLKRDGYEPAELYASMTWWQRLAPAALWPITLPTLLDKRTATPVTGAKPAPRINSPELSSAILTRTFTQLRKRTRSAVPATAASEWSDYPANLTHYTAEESAAKAAWVRATLDSTRPGHGPYQVLDIGANTGEFSALAASLGADVTALERDGPAADRLHRMAVTRGLSIQTIHADFARPTPAAGWENAESAALLPRLEGRFDLILMLAVIHHLILMEQIPIPAILTLIHRLTTRHLILEWVPASDPMFQSLMRGRDALYAHLTEADLLNAATPLYATRSRHPLGNGRVLFLFEKISSPATIDA